MSRSVNVVHLLGNLTKDAETTHTQSGTAVTKFKIATNFRTKVQGEWEDQTEYHNVVSFNAENVAQYLSKGSAVHVTGRLQTRSYEKDGQKRYFTEVIVSNRDITLVGNAERGTSKQHTEQRSLIDDDVPF